MKPYEWQIMQNKSAKILKFQEFSNKSDQIKFLEFSNKIQKNLKVLKLST